MTLYNKKKDLQMPFNHRLADRVRYLLEETGLPIEEKQMMGGLTFMVNSKMCVGILNDDLMARIAPEDYPAALSRPGCREMDLTGKPMKGFVFINESGTGSTEGLKYWINLALAFNPRAKSSGKPVKKT
jgi:hypothetical protein